MLELLDLRERGGRLEPSKLEIDPAITETVRQILQRVFVEGDDVLVELSKQFDGADLSRSGILVTEREFAHAERETIVRPLASVGCYVPGGRAKYPSTVAMTVVPATVAGVEEIVVCTPPQRDGSIHAAVLYAAKRAGATDVARTGGAQAVAAMAYGTESIPSVDRIVGPGNVYVTEAKRQVAGFVGIDGLAGPSELAIVADGDVDPRMAALDLIAQAEHDPEARTFFVTPDAALAEKVDAALEQELAHVGRREIVDLAIRHTKLVLVRDLQHAAAAVNDVAAEHLLLLLGEPEDFLPSVRNAGAIFLGSWSAVPFGDYGLASNHVLPTAGTARFSSGLRAADYVTITSVMRMSPAATAHFSPGTS
ncbi:MAG: histidinol dehydrogenase, partial [Actinobacteria bacterium]